MTLPLRGAGKRKGTVGAEPLKTNSADSVPVAVPQAGNSSSHLGYNNAEPIRLVYARQERQGKED